MKCLYELFGILCFLNHLLMQVWGKANFMLWVKPNHTLCVCCYSDSYSFGRWERFHLVSLWNTSLLCYFLKIKFLLQHKCYSRITLYISCTRVSHFSKESWIVFSPQTGVSAFFLFLVKFKIGKYQRFLNIGMGKYFVSIQTIHMIDL